MRTPSRHLKNRFKVQENVLNARCNGAILPAFCQVEPVINQVAFEDDKFIMELVDGRSLSVPLTWYPRLLAATLPERVNWHLLGDGFGIEWPDLDEHISVEGLLAGRRSGENMRSFKRWLAQRN